MNSFTASVVRSGLDTATRIIVIRKFSTGSAEEEAYSFAYKNTMQNVLPTLPKYTHEIVMWIFFFTVDTSSFTVLRTGHARSTAGSIHGEMAVPVELPSHGD